MSVASLAGRFVLLGMVVPVIAWSGAAPVAVRSLEK